MAIEGSKEDLLNAIGSLPIAVSTVNGEGKEPDDFICEIINSALSAYGEQLPKDDIPPEAWVLVAKDEGKYEILHIPIFLLGESKDIWALVIQTVLSSAGGFGYILFSECWFAALKREEVDNYDKLMEETGGTLENYEGREERLMGNYFASGYQRMFYRSILEDRKLGPICEQEMDNNSESKGRFPEICPPSN